jgi:hypothetical protein
MIRELLTSVCNQPSAMGLPFGYYCVGIYSGIAIFFPLFLWVWRRHENLRLSVFIAAAVPLLGLMICEFILHHPPLLFTRGTWSLPFGARVLIGLGNGIAFSAIAAFFWNYLLGDSISLRSIYVVCIAAGAVLLFATRNPVELFLLLGVFLRFVVSNALIAAALLNRRLKSAYVPISIGFALSCLEWWLLAIAV